MPHAKPEERRKYAREYYKHRYHNDPDYKAKLLAWRKTRQRRYYLRSRHGIDLPEFERLKNGQNGVCALCNREIARELAVDHCHKDGHIRGLLCSKCNGVLGWVETIGLDRIVKYLNNPPTVDRMLGHLEKWDRRIRDGLNKSQRYRLRDLEKYRKQKREYAKTPKQRERRRIYGIEYRARMKALLLRVQSGYGCLNANS